MGLGLAGWLMAAPGLARAHDAYDDSQSHPLLLVSYLIHPIGWAVEWTLTRPVHFLVSQPKLERIFGHTPHENPYGDYETYLPDR